jgi:hypothetical protein
LFARGTCMGREGDRADKRQDRRLWVTLLAAVN